MFDWCRGKAKNMEGEGQRRAETMSKTFEISAGKDKGEMGSI